jgi:hypothetical protein
MATLEKEKEQKQQQQQQQQLIEFCGIAANEVGEIMESIDNAVNFHEQAAKKSAAGMVHRQAADDAQKGENLKKILEVMQKEHKNLDDTCQMISSLRKRIKKSVADDNVTSTSKTYK